MGKEILFKVLRHEKAERIPWVPFAGVHAGKLKGYNAIEVLKEPDKLYESLMEVHRLYQPDGMPIMFDLQLEAEILGCGLLWADNNPPSVSSSPYVNSDDLPTDDMIPKKDQGRIPMILEVMDRMKRSVGDETALYGLITGPLTLATHLRGSEIFMDMLKRKDKAEQLFDFCTKVAIAMAGYYIDAGMDVIAVVDPLVSQISPKSFSKQLHDPYVKIFDYIRERGAFSSFFVCGDASKQIRVMCETHPDSMHVDENVKLAESKLITDEFNIVMGGNIPLTTTMLFGNQQDNMKAVIDIYDSVPTKTNFILSPGCDMPYDVPIENGVAVAQAVLRTDEIREQVANYESVLDLGVEVELPEYDKLDKVLIELCTLDPDQCAACGYMVKLVEDTMPQMEDIAEYVVYRYNRKEDIARFMKMGIGNLPTMCIDGEQKYVSLIPHDEELIEAVKEAYAKKH